MPIIPSCLTTYLEGENLREQKHFNDRIYGSPVMLRKKTSRKIHTLLQKVLGMI